MHVLENELRDNTPCLQGFAKVNESVELPKLREQKKIKSMQIFKKPQQHCHQVKMSHSLAQHQNIML